MTDDITHRPWPLVGRRPQLLLAEEVLARGTGHGLVVFGPAGVGKSRLARECLRIAEERGYAVARAQATAAAAAVPLGAISHLVPTPLLPDDPLTAVRQTADHLRSRASRTGLVLLLDDLHLLDHTSVLLLRQLMDTDAVVLLATARTGHPGTAAAAGFVDDRVARTDLSCLDPRETRELLVAVLGHPVSGRTVHHLHTTSGGNPLYLRELVRSALDRGSLVHDGELWDLVEAFTLTCPHLEELISARLDQAPAGTRTALELLALREPVPLRLLTRTVPDGRLDTLEDSGLVHVVRDHRRVSARLAHPLYGEVLRARLTALRHRDLLLLHADLVEGSGARRREDPPVVETDWLEATGEIRRPELLAAAAGQAAALGDHARALELIRTVPPAMRSFPLWMLYGRTLYEAGEFTEAEEVLGRLVTRAPGPREREWAITARAQNLVAGLGRTFHEVWPVVEEDWPMPPDGTLSAGLLALRATTATQTWNYTEAVDACAAFTALRDAQQEHDSGPAAVDPELLVGMAEVMSSVFLGRGAAARGRMAEVEAIEIPETVSAMSRETLELARRTMRVLMLAECGDLDAALATGAEYAGSAHGDVRMLLITRGRAALLAGDLVQARQLFAEVVRASRRHVAYMLPEALSLLAATAAQLGDMSAARRALTERDRLGLPESMTELRLGPAWLLAAEGRLGEARELLLGAAEDSRKAGCLQPESILLTDVVRLDGAALAVDRLTELAATCSGAFYRARARFARAAADHDADGLEEAACALADVGARLVAAEALTMAASLHHHEGRGRKAQACTRLAETLLARCVGARTPALRTRSHLAAFLTPRETEIALIAVEGLRSREIAAQLHLSIRTVENHLLRVYNKLGINGRAELAEALGGVRV
ncbi:LuxR C-terminal-related transcriptional regulator [Streptomyces sp. NPDC001586]|uniref:LuxR C-terminal-related transcriptional regulator n=1 Tax=Streptomyces sp. NPDC001586 TaxID=3154387 RepID=UPI00332E74DE